MKKVVIEKFRNGKWLHRSNSLLGDKNKVSAVLMHSTRYIKKGGLRKVREEIGLLRAYISDVIKGRYNGYDRSSLTLSLAAIIYVISPLDLVPDFVPLGLLDDVSIVAWAVSQLAGELERYKCAKAQAEDAPSDDSEKPAEESSDHCDEETESLKEETF